MQYEALPITATSSGSIALYTANAFKGYVNCVGYVPTTSSTGLTPTTGGSIVVTSETVGREIFSLYDIGNTGAVTRAWYPRAATVPTSCCATASTGSAMIPLYNQRLLVTVTSGSTDLITKTGTMYFYIDQM